MNELQNTVFQLLREFDRICRENNIEYFAVGGTLLGSVRHKGFIPWDDDVDVGMLRQEYDKFLKVAPRLLPDYYFLQHYTTDPGFVFGFTKMRDSRTTFLESRLKNRKMNHGIYIDIFPFDYYPENQIKQEVLILKKRFLSARVRQTFLLKESDINSRIGEYCANILGNIVALKYPTVVEVLKIRDTLYSSVPRSTLVNNYYGVWGKREIVPLLWVKETKELSFEGLNIMVPMFYDAYLRNIYGDYMTLPPIEKRVSRHDTDVVDSARPYTEYLN